jgi:signal peptide peptidase SppA
VLTKGWSFWNYWYGWSSYDQIAHDLEVALAAPDVRAILLSVDSGGGMVDGCAELAERLVAARASGKPIVAHVDGMGASAAYWTSSAAQRVVLAPTAMVGSIGVVMTFTDWSGYEATLGVRTIEIVSTQSPKKLPDPAEEAGRAQLQVHVDDMASVFLSAVATQRGVALDVVAREFGQGDVFVGQRAIDAGLADSLGTYEATHRALAASVSTLTVALPYALGTSGDSAAIAEHVTAALAAAFPHHEDAMARKPATRPAAAETPVEDEEKETPADAVEDAPVEEEEETPADAAEGDPVEEEEEEDADASEDEDEEAKALAKSHRPVVARIRERAAAAERTRIAEIRALGRPGQDAVIEACIADGRCTPEKAALALLQSERKTRAQHLRGVASEEAQLEKPDNSGTPQPSGDTATAKAIASLFHQHNPKRRPTAAGRS